MQLIMNDSHDLQLLLEYLCDHSLCTEEIVIITKLRFLDMDKGVKKLLASNKQIKKIDIGHGQKQISLSDYLSRIALLPDPGNTLCKLWVRLNNIGEGLNKDL